MAPEIREGIRTSNDYPDSSDSDSTDSELAPDGESASPQLQHAKYAASLERVLRREGTWSGIKSSIVNNRYNVKFEVIPLELRRQLEGVVTDPKPYNSNAQMLLYRGIPLARKTISKSSESGRRLVEREIAAGRALYGIQHIIKLVGTYDSSQRDEVTASILTFPVMPCTLAQFLDDYEALHRRAEPDLEVPRLSLAAKLLLQPSSPEPSRLGYWTPKLEDGTLDRLSALGLLSGKNSTKAQTLEILEWRLKELMGCLTQAVSWMHARNVGHYNLKPSNILLGSGQLYISDFGHSTTSSSSSTILRGAPGRGLYTAPELYSSKSAVPLKADIYSLGCIFLNIITVLYGNKSGSRSREALTWTLSRQPHSLEANINLYIRTKLHLLDDWQINKRRVYVGKQGHHPFTVQMIAPLLAMEPENRPDAKTINEVLWTSGALERLYHGPCCRRGTVTVQTLVKNVDESPQQVENPKLATKAKFEAAKAKATADWTKTIKFKDSLGRKFNFPFELCKTWEGMNDLIRQAFAHVEPMAQMVADGNYDLIGPTGEIILPQVWETVVEPDWMVSMNMWPVKEPSKEEQQQVPQAPQQRHLPPPLLGPSQPQEARQAQEQELTQQQQAQVSKDKPRHSPRKYRVVIDNILHQKPKNKER